MTHSQRPIFLLLLAATLTLCASVLTGCGPASVAAATDPQPAPRVLTVIGRGDASAKPNLATISVGVETFAESVAEASSENNTRMAGIMAKLKELGIAEKDIQTSNFSIQSERQPSRDGSEEEMNYRVSNMVTIKVRDLDKAGSTLDAVIAAGANQVWGINFVLEDTNALEAQARSKAMDDAKARAEALAKLNGVSLGRVMTVNEGGAGDVVYGGMALAKGADETAIHPGEVQFRSQVQVTFEIR